MTESTHQRLLLCEKHAGIIGRQAARLVQTSPEDSLRELRLLLQAVADGRLGTCSADFCVTGDPS